MVLGVHAAEACLLNPYMYASKVSLWAQTYDLFILYIGHSRASSFLIIFGLRKDYFERKIPYIPHIFQNFKHTLFSTIHCFYYLLLLILFKCTTITHIVQIVLFCHRFALQYDSSVLVLSLHDILFLIIETKQTVKAAPGGYSNGALYNRTCDRDHR